MTIPKEAIEKAIEGGWLENDDSRHNDDHGSYNYQAIALDPHFWQSLGKALGWRSIYFKQTVPARKVRGGTHPAHIRTQQKPTPNRWKKEAHRFYDLILTGADTTAFWDDLLERPFSVTD